MENVIKRILPHGKKGFNDAYILGIILFILIGVGLILPFVDNEFNTNNSNFDTANVGNQLVGSSTSDSTSIKTFDILKSIGKMFFWTFGDIPFWLDGIFLVLRIILLIILLKNFVPFLGGG